MQSSTSSSLHNSYGTINDDTLIDTPQEQQEQLKPTVSRFTSISTTFWWLMTCAPMIHLLLLFVQFLYGGFSVLGGMALKHINPIVFGCFRITLMTTAIVPISFVMDNGYWRKAAFSSDSGSGCCSRLRLIPEWKDGLTMMCLGLLVAYNVFSYVAAVSLTPYLIVAIIQPTSPVFVCILSVLLRRERGTILKFVGVFLGVTGSIATLLIVTFVGKGHDPDHPAAKFDVKVIVGACIELSNAMMTAVYIVLQKTVLDRGIPPLTAMAWALVTALPISFSVASFFFKDFSPADTPRITWIGIGYAGLAIGAGAFSISMFANKYSSPTTIAIYNTTAPVFSIVFGLIFTGERPSPFVLFGAAGITAGVILVAVGKQREDRQKKQAALEEAEEKQKLNVDTQVQESTDLFP
jgi:drug/metabolite transporter (DMT)-like permease